MKRLILFLTCTIFPLTGTNYADTSAITGIVSARITQDGRPLLWQNLQSDVEIVQCRYFRGPTYHFMGMIVGQDTSGVFAGLNTAGFALAISKSAFSGKSPELAAIFIKYALGTCGRVDEFEFLLSKTTNPSAGQIAFACMDSYGEAAIFEVPNPTRFSLNPIASPEGFIVRAGFTLTGTLSSGPEFWRYHRAGQLLQEAHSANQLNPSTILRKVLRDVQTLQLDPYPLPFEGQVEGAPNGYVKCIGSINQCFTRYGIVIHGVRTDEKPEFSTLWAVLGEPLCGIAVPLWPITGGVPRECSGKNPLLYNRTRLFEKTVYNHNGYPYYVNTFELAHPQHGLWMKLEAIQERIFQQTRAHKILWHRSPTYRKDMLDFQMKTAEDLGRQLY